MAAFYDGRQLVSVMKITEDYSRLLISDSGNRILAIGTSDSTWGRSETLVTIYDTRGGWIRTITKPDVFTPADLTTLESAFLLPIELSLQVDAEHGEIVEIADGKSARTRLCTPLPRLRRSGRAEFLMYSSFTDQSFFLENVNLRRRSSTPHRTRAGFFACCRSGGGLRLASVACMGVRSNDGAAGGLLLFFAAGREIYRYVTPIAGSATKMRSACFLGDSPAIQQVRRIVMKVADAPFPILLEGETGSGKYEAAALLHERSRRASSPFVEIHCANLTETLFESTLFGHERGAFTDARERQMGRVELAEQGTILFDEIDCLNDVCQAKLLRLVDRRSYERVGGRTTMTTPVRMIFASNQNVQDLVQKHEFRSDLFERISWLVIRLPPLRERAHDIPLLASLFLEEARVLYALGVLRWSEGALAALARYSWPGNVRELKSFTHVAAYLFSGNEVVRASDVESLLAARTRNSATANDINPTLASQRTDVERQVIADALRRTSGNRAHAAQLLKVSRRTLQTKIAKYRL